MAISPAAKSHMWDWPKHRVADVEAEANANETKLTSGQIGLHQLYSDAGFDLEDEIPAMAATFGVDEQEIRKCLLDVILPPVNQPTRPVTAQDGAIEQIFRRALIPGGSNGKQT